MAHPLHMHAATTTRYACIACLLVWTNAIAAATVSVLDHGADAAGQLDSTAAVTAAIAAAGTSGTVLFPPGTYLVGSGGAVQLGQYLFEPRDRQQFIGTDATLRVATPPAGVERCRIFHFNQVRKGITTGVVFQGLRFEADRRDPAIRLWDSVDCEVRSCTFIGCGILLWDGLDDGTAHGNSGTRIIACRFDNADYQDPTVNPGWRPGQGYSNEQLAGFRNYLQFQIRIMSYPWDADLVPANFNQDILVEGCEFAGAAYNAVECAGHAVRGVTVRGCRFQRCHGTAIDFDKGASDCLAEANAVHDMRPSEQHASGELYAIGAQRGGDFERLRSDRNTFRNNVFHQSNLPYRKIRLNNSLGCTIEGNTVLAGDLGGDAVSIGFTGASPGSSQTVTTIRNNRFRTGKIYVGGELRMDPPMLAPLVITDNDIAGPVEIANHRYDQLEFSRNRCTWAMGISEGFKFSKATVASCGVADNVFKATGAGVSVAFTHCDDLQFNGNGLIGIDPIRLEAGFITAQGTTVTGSRASPCLTLGATTEAILRQTLFASCTGPALLRITGAPELSITDTHETANGGTGHDLGTAIRREEVGNFWQTGDHLPLLVFDSPADGASLDSPLTISARSWDPDAGAADGAGIAHVRYELSQASVVAMAATISVPPYRWTIDPRALALGSWRLTAVATPGSGASSTRGLNLYRQADPRTITIQVQAGGTTVPGLLMQSSSLQPGILLPDGRIRFDSADARKEQIISVLNAQPG